MNIRLTIGLAVVLVVVIIVGVVVSSGGGGGSPDRVQLPSQFFYQVSGDDINKVVITHQGTTYQFVSDSQGGWHFDRPGGELVDLNRWGGVTLLLSGPQYKRKLAIQPNELDRFGLDRPRTTVVIGLRGVGDVKINIGDQTPTGASNYTQFQPLITQAQADPGVYLVDSSWGDVMARLVTDPPRVPTPTPAPSAEGTPSTPAAQPTAPSS